MDCVSFLNDYEKTLIFTFHFVEPKVLLPYVSRQSKNHF